MPLFHYFLEPQLFLIPRKLATLYKIFKTKMDDVDGVSKTNNKNEVESSKCITPNGLNNTDTEERPSCKYGKQCFR